MEKRHRPKAEDAQESLSGHAVYKGEELRAKYGTDIGWEQLHKILEDRTLVRYPCEIEFTAEGLEDGEFAFPQPKGETPEDGFVMRVHPVFQDRPDVVPGLVFYQLVAVNYGPFASADDAEAFGAAALGMDKDEYYRALCGYADELKGCGGAAGNCGCGG